MFVFALYQNDGECLIQTVGIFRKILVLSGFFLITLTLQTAMDKSGVKLSEIDDTIISDLRNNGYTSAKKICSTLNGIP